MKKNFFLLVQISVIYLLFFSVSLADIQKKLINKITATKTLSFNFKQKIEGEEENGTCYIKYPLLMRSIIPAKPLPLYTGSNNSPSCLASNNMASFIASVGMP